VSEPRTLLVLALILGCGDGESLQRAELLDAEGQVLLALRLAIADTEYERQEGLRLHGPLHENEALLLVFPTESRVCIANDGVPFSVDLVYLDAGYDVIAIERKMAPNDPGPYCHPGAQMVLELNAGELPQSNPMKLELF
jgi:hypothetical protein